ncbi:MAG: hypothetical protein JWQ78_1426, partial [Sediminibacterium sp.]|nr:hypothetical protein [Sediminibacterium sp.]
GGIGTIHFKVDKMFGGFRAIMVTSGIGPCGVGYQVVYVPLKELVQGFGQRIYCQLVHGFVYQETPSPGHYQ